MELLPNNGVEWLPMTNENKIYKINKFLLDNPNTNIDGFLKLFVDLKFLTSPVLVVRFGETNLICLFDDEIRQIIKECNLNNPTMKVIIKDYKLVVLFGNSDINKKVNNMLLEKMIN